MTAMARGAWRRAGWLLRTAALGVAVTVVFSRLGAAGTDEARDQMMAVGAEMLRVPEPPQAGSSDRLLFNGAELDVTRGRSAQSVDQLLAAAEASCTARAGGASPLRGGGDERGFVACQDPSAQRRLIERAGAAVSGDGAMTLPIAYLYAERRGGATHFIRFLSEEPIDLRALFPREGDAPGPDTTALPRPRSSRRALGMRVAGQPYDAAVYLDREQGVRPARRPLPERAARRRLDRRRAVEGRRGSRSAAGVRLHPAERRPRHAGRRPGPRRPHHHNPHDHGGEQ